MEHITDNKLHSTKHITHNKKHNKLLRVMGYVLREKGFTILETLFAIVVITVGLVGVIGLIVYTISISRVSPDKVIAANLAQEGIEIVRNIRDSNWIEDVSWDKDIPLGNSVPIFTDSNRNDWPSDPDKWKLIHIGVAESWKEKVYYDTEDQFYGQSKEQSSNPAQFPENWVLTNFTRKITITNNPDGKAATDDIRVKCQVDWTDRSGATHTITLEDHLYDYVMPPAQTHYHWEREGVMRPCDGSCEIAPCDTGDISEECIYLNGKQAFASDPNCLRDEALPAGNCRHYNKIID